MCISESRNQVLLTTVPPKAKGGIYALHQVLLNQSVHRKYGLIPFEYSSSNPFEEKFVSRLFRIFIGANHFVHRLSTNHSIRIVHINTAPDSRALLRDAVLVVISRLLRRKVILQVHGAISDYDYPGAVWWLASKFFPLCQKILVFSKKDVKKVEELVPNDRILAFPNGIRVDDFSGDDQTLKEDLAIPEENRVVLFISRLIKEKGGFEVLDAVPEVVKAFQKVSFVFAGDGPELGRMKEICAEKGLENWVRFTGHLQYRDVLRAFGCSDIFVLPTYYVEGLPMALLQALASGLAVISTSAGAIPDIIEDGVNGFLIQPRSPDQLAEKIVFLLENDDVRKRIKLCNKELAKKEFDVAVIRKKLDTLYSDL